MTGIRIGKDVIMKRKEACKILVNLKKGALIYNDGLHSYHQLMQLVRDLKSCWKWNRVKQRKVDNAASRWRLDSSCRNVGVHYVPPVEKFIIFITNHPDARAALRANNCADGRGIAQNLRLWIFSITISKEGWAVCASDATASTGFHFFMCADWERGLVALVLILQWF